MTRHTKMTRYRPSSVCAASWPCPAATAAPALAKCLWAHHRLWGMYSRHAGRAGQRIPAEIHSKNTLNLFFFYNMHVITPFTELRQSTVTSPPEVISIAPIHPVCVFSLCVSWAAPLGFLFPSDSSVPAWEPSPAPPGIHRTFSWGCCWPPCAFATPSTLLSGSRHRNRWPPSLLTIGAETTATAE